VIRNLAPTCHPILVVEDFKILTVNEPSASMNPVRNQGLILELEEAGLENLGAKEENCLLIILLNCKDAP
jgi:hypothetical protein